ncbi:hypothetical protein JKA74_05280 [Marivirga sp. S37H4]|uniref:Uncharacterized protein n=1 Tax=Marivirga aurantiaca TaxID=2802615 RepID=A0A934WWY2_9BACT|nr:hypothetical protein [Marivirga aurantiaca]MBK6264441.1 hypothetical protein [Marivirga aurantiaca]
MIFKKNKEFIMIVSMGIILVVMILLILPSRDSAQLYQLDKCRWSRNMKIQTFNGVVIKKFRDTNEHNYPTLFFDQVGRKTSIKIEFQNEISGFYDYVTVGDLIRKKSNTLLVDIIRSNENIKIVLDYGCHEK